jgi:hypothetical protein
MPSRFVRPFKLLTRVERLKGESIVGSHSAWCGQQEETMDNFIDPTHSSYAYHVAVCGSTRGFVRNNLAAAKEDAKAFGKAARVVPLLSRQAQPLLVRDKQLQN